MELKNQCVRAHFIFRDVTDLLGIKNLLYPVWLWYLEAENSMGFGDRWPQSASSLCMTIREPTYS